MDGDPLEIGLEGEERADEFVERDEVVGWFGMGDAVGFREGWEREGSKLGDVDSEDVTSEI